MKELFVKYKNIFLVVIIAVAVFFLYSFFFKGDDETLNSLLKVQSGSGNSQDAAIGKEFLTLLLELRSLDLDETLFSDKSFQILEDFSQEVKPQPTGRDNPFLKIGNDPATPDIREDAQDSTGGADL